MIIGEEDISTAEFEHQAFVIEEIVEDMSFLAEIGNWILLGSVVTIIIIKAVDYYLKYMRQREKNL